MKAINKKYFFFILIALASIIYLKQIQWASLLAWLLQLTGFQALICFCLVFILGSIFLLPIGLPLNLLAGLLWGTIAGGILINALATLVAALSFFLAKYAGRYFLNDFFAKYAVLNKLKTTINRYDWQFIAMARINPIVPFSLSNYLFGLIPELSFRHYILATFIANLLPGFAIAAIGSVFKTISLENNPIRYVVIEIGIALLLVSGLIMLKMLAPDYRRKATDITRLEL